MHLHILRGTHILVVNVCNVTCDKVMCIWLWPQLTFTTNLEQKKIYCQPLCACVFAGMWGDCGQTDTGVHHLWTISDFLREVHSQKTLVDKFSLKCLLHVTQATATITDSLRDSRPKEFSQNHQEELLQVLRRSVGSSDSPNSTLHLLRCFDDLSVITDLLQRTH